MWFHTPRQLFQRDKIDHQIVLYGENSVRLEIRVVARVDLCDDGLVVVVGDFQVYVGGAHGVSVQFPEQLARGAVGREGVRSGSQAVEAVLAVLVGFELAAQVVVGLVGWVLEVVLAVAARLPEIEGYVRYGFLCREVAYYTVHICHVPFVGILDHAVAELAPGGVGGPEGPENGGGCGDVVGFACDMVGDFCNEAGKVDNC